ncbi:MAG TPA: type II toxin-antitoxin system RelE/ParE family toxin [Steroidobacter sp.]|nr:type II toxin-antitoxin system RelE/ParE family toxin [Steroidobacter sp.]
MKYEFHPEAELELCEAALRYEAEVPELGRRFGEEVERVVYLLLDHPEMGARVDESLRHFVLRKFPFPVVYAVASDLIYIIVLSRMAAVNLSTGGCESRIANKLSEPTCETHAAQQWR